jgi:Restriction endonuclease BpuJI - N terminal/Domain of unknown function (DUF3883)
VRSRFKNDVEAVLGFMATQISSLGELSSDEHRLRLNAAIRSFPGNAHISPKTIDNWRTEISSLFGLVTGDNDSRRPTELALHLAAQQDLIGFFRHFLLRFQYPGSHLKPSQVARMIEAGVRFHPAKFIIDFLLEGQKTNPEARFGLSKAEATHMIWNDLRVTRGEDGVEDVVSRVKANRDAKVDYHQPGDVVRQAGDLLDYMVLADLLVRESNGRYYLKRSNLPVALKLRDNALKFDGFDGFYGRQGLTAREVREVEWEWFDFAGTLADVDFSPDPLVLLEAIAQGSSAGDEQGVLASLLLGPLREKLGVGEKIASKDIGNAGEAIVIAHEQQRLAKSGFEKLANKVKKIPDHFGIGYDILSFVGAAEIQKFIEVKTSVTHGEIFMGQCHMTPPEWGSAETNRQSYFIFRIMISTKSVRCFVIQDPVGMYKSEKLNMTVRDGANLSYGQDAGFWEELLV